MRQQFDLAQLGRIASQAIGVPSLDLRAEDSAEGVPGWDSLNHTLITLEIGEAIGVELSPAETAACPDFGSLVALVNARMRLG